MSAKFKSICIVLLLTLSLQANDKNTHLAVIELGLKQEASIPMIMKNYLMVEMHNDFSKPRDKLKKEIKYFGLLQEKLLKLPLDKETKEVILEHQKLWGQLKAILDRTVTKERFLDMRKYSYPLGESLKKITENSKNKINERDCSIIYYAGKLSAVSQRLASVYMRMNWGKDISKLKVTMLIEKSIYSDTLVKLEKELSSSSSKMDGGSKKILAMLKKYFEYYKFLEHETKIYKPTLIYTKTNTMFKYSNKMMETLLKKVKK